MEVLRIRWIDSAASNIHWCIFDELDGEIEPISIVTYGVLIQETNYCITVAQNFGFNPKQFCSLMTIPKGCIIERVVIDRIKEEHFNKEYLEEK